MNLKQLLLLIPGLFLASCTETTTPTETEETITVIEESTAPVFQNKAHEIIYEMTQKAGDYQMLKDRKDVVYSYTYVKPDGSIDVSTEKYMFDGELSYGIYEQHGKTMPDLEGKIEQGYDGNEFWVKHNESYLEDEKSL